MSDQVIDLGKEWIMIGTSDPQNFYMGKLVPKEPSPPKPTTLQDVRDYISSELSAGRTIHLTQARLLYTMVQLMQNGGVSMITQLMPISGSARPVDLYFSKADVLMFPSEIDGMAERLSAMSTALSEKEIENRAKAAGIVSAIPIPNPHLSRKA